MMKQNNKVFSKRSGLLSAGTLSVLLALGGCGGGGGGGGSAVTRTTVFPNLEQATDIDGFVAPYSLDTDNFELDSVAADVFGARANSGEITLTVEPTTLPDNEVEPRFVFTFDPASIGSPQMKSPLDSLSLMPSCVECLRTVTVTTTDGPESQVTIMYLDPSSIGLTFSALGMWSKPTTVGESIWREVGGPFSAGVPANGALLPTTGIASYEGFFIGRFVTSDATLSPAPGTYLVGANAHAAVNFGAGGVTFSTSNTQISDGGLMAPVSEPRLNLITTALPINRAKASFAGNLGPTTNGFLMDGNIAGGFYGPGSPSSAPPELGGAVAVGNNIDKSMVGSFALTKQP